MRISDWSSDVCSSDLQFVPRLQHQPLGAVFPKFALFIPFKNCRSFRRVSIIHYIRRIEDKAQFIASYAVGSGIPCIKFGSYLRTSTLVKGKRFSTVTEILSPG